MSIGRSLVLVAFFLLLPLEIFAQAPTITTAANLGRQQRGVLEFQLAATGGATPYVFSFTPGFVQSSGFRVHNRIAPDTLPSFFPANITRGLLGVATTPGVQTFSIRVTGNDNLFSDKVITFEVIQVLLGQSSLRETSVNEFYSYQLESGGGTAPYSYALAPASPAPPAGLALSAAGLVSGTPTIAGAFNFTVRVTDNVGQFGDFNVSVTVRPLRFDSPRVLPTALVGSLYSHTLQVSGGTGPYTWSLTLNNTLPSDFTLSPNGTITGTPTFVANWNTTVRVTDFAGNFIDRRIDIPITTNTATPPSFNVGTFDDATVGRGVRTWLGVTGGVPPYVYSVQSGTLPDGLHLKTGFQTHVLDDAGFPYLEGRPTAVGQSSFTLRVTDSVGNFNDRVFTWKTTGIFIENSTVSPNPLVNTFFSYPFLPIGGVGTRTFGLFDELPGGTTLSAGGVLSGTPLDTGNHQFQVRLFDSTGQSLVQTATIFVRSSTPTTLKINFVGNSENASNLGTRTLGSISFSIFSENSTLPNPAYSYSLAPGSVLPPGWALLQGNSLPAVSQQNVTSQFAGSLTTPGSYEFTLNATDAAGNSGTRTFHIQVSPLFNITNTFVLDPGSVGMPYSYQFIGEGGTGPYVWSMGGFAPGLTITPGGLIQGIPQVAGTYSFSVFLSDSAGNSTSTSHRIDVSELGITNPSSLTAVAGAPFSVIFNATGPGAPYVWTSPTFAPTGLGLTLNQNTGELSGTLSTLFVSSTVFNLTVGDAAGTRFFTKRFYLNVSNTTSDFTLNIVNIPNIAETSVGILNSIVLTANAGTPPYSWSLKAGSLPPGLQIVSGPHTFPTTAGSEAPVLRGIPRVAGVYPFTLEVTDSAGLKTHRDFSMGVSPLQLATAALRTGILGVSYSGQLVATGGQAPYTFEQISGVLPKGMNLTSSGLIVGIPETTGAYAIGLKLADSAGNETPRVVVLNITLGSPITTTVTTIAGPQADASVGIFRSITMILSGGIAPYTMSIEPGSTLPPGMTLLVSSPTFTSISGIPTSPGNFEFIVRVTDALGNFGLRPLSMRVTPLNIVTPLFFNFNTFNVTLPAARVGTPYSYTFSSVNGTGPYTYGLATGSFLPEGLRISPTGTISGTPATSEAIFISVMVTDSKGITLTRSYTLNVYPGASALSGFVLFPQASQGDSYAVELNRFIILGNPPYTWQLVDGSTLPPGLLLTPGSGGSSDFINGIPTTAGSYPISIRVTDSAGRAVTTTNTTLVVSKLSMQPAVVSPGMANQAYSETFLAGGGTPPYTFQLASGSSMPLGLNLSPSGVLSGIPLTVGTFGFGVQVTDAAANVLLRNYVLTIGPAGVPVSSLTVVPYAFSLAYVQGAPNPPSVPVNVGSPLPGLSFTASVVGGSWATPVPAAGTTPGGFFLNFDPSGMLPGTYNAVLVISSAVAVNSPRLIPITLTVAAPIPCTFSVSPAESTLAAQSGGGSFSVNTAAGCSWAASSSAPWVTFNGGSSGTGPAGVNFQVAANTGTAQRTATIGVAGQQHTIIQFGTAVSYNILPSSASVAAGGGVGNFNLIASSPTAAWTATPTVPWITVTSASIGNGSAVIEISVAANPDLASRSGGVNVAGLTFNVNQDAAGCAFDLYPSSAPMAYNGGDVSTDLSTAAGCFSSVTNLPSWITIVSGGTGTGPRTIALNVTANTGTQSRAATALIGGQPFVVTQAGVPCSFTLTSTNIIRPATASSGNVTIKSAGTGCIWTATDNVDWISAVLPASGTGDGAVTFNIAANPNPTNRTGTLTIAGQNLLITQAGTSCSFALQSSSASAVAVGGDSSVGVMAPAGCAWSARSNVPWMAITAGTASSGTGPAAFNVQPNATGATRAGTLTIATQTFNVTQTGAVCNITLNSTSNSLIEAGGLGSFTFSATGSNCVPNISSQAGWITITSATFDGSSGAVNYSAAPNITSGPRSGRILVADAAFTINEAPAVCNYTLPVTGAVFDRFGGEGTVDFTLTSGTATPCTPVVGPVPGFGAGLHVGGLSGTGPGYLQFYSVDPYQTFIRWVRTMIMTIGGQNFVIKQNSF